jgi:hypothetical protein
MRHLSSFLFATLLFSAFTIQGQSNVQTYTPSVLLRPQQIEVGVFNNFYTQEGFRDGEGEFVDLMEQQTYYTAMIQFNYGISKNSRINLGLDVNLQSVRLDPDPESSMFRVLRFEDTSFARTAITGIGPRVKFRPVDKWTGFSVSSAFWIPVADSMENYPFLAWDRFTWWNQFFYDQKLTENTRLFVETDLLFRLPRYGGQSILLSLPTSAFLSWFPTSKSTVYVMSQYSPEFQRLSEAPGDGSSQAFYNSYFLQIGAGAKYQVTNHLQLEFLYTNFAASQNAGAGATWNLGIKFIK